MTIKMSPYQSFIATNYKPAVHRGMDLSGTISGGYFIFGCSGSTLKTNGYQYNWAVRCVTCYKLFIIGKQSVLRNTKGCKICAQKITRASNSPHWKGSGDISGYFLSKIIAGATRKSRTLAVTITTEDIDILWKEQGGSCAYTDWELSLGTAEVQQTASLDRIDSSLGYTPGNIQFVHKDINKMKWDLPEDRFLELCNAVSMKKVK